MAMNGTTLGDDIWTIVKSISGTTVTGPQDAQGRALWEAIASKIVSHIQTNGQVLPGITVTTSGSPSNQTGVTTAPGVIT